LPARGSISRAFIEGLFVFTLDFVMERQPTLTIEGFGVGMSKRPFCDMRQHLVVATDMIDAALAYLKAGAPLNSAPSAGMYSYSLKHRAEKWAGRYISNGAMIAAALMLGWKVKRAWNDGLNATVWPPKGYRKRLPELAEAAK
jgi:hypothetical protein